MKEELCKAFCGDVTVRNVPAGLAVGTVFRGLGGDLVGFYVTGSPALGYRIVDDGATVAFLEAAGCDMSNSTRADALRELITQYDVEYDEQSGELRTAYMSMADIPRAAVRFIAMMIRIPDLLLLVPERVVSTFEDDARLRIRKALEGQARIVEDEPIAPGLREFRADMVLKAANRQPVAVFFSRSEQRVYEAILCQMAALYEQHVPCSVIALLEKGSSISHRMRQRASNRLTAIPDYEGDEDAAISRIVREVIGNVRSPIMH